MYGSDCGEDVAQLIFCAQTNKNEKLCMSRHNNNLYRYFIPVISER
jgi:hypothetical protein